MKSLKRFLALGLAAMMTLSLAACGGGNDGAGTATGDGTQGAATNPGTVTTDGYAHYDSNGNRVILMACWWDRYYDSDDTALDDDPSFSYTEDGEIKVADQMRFDVVAAIEAKYDVKLQWINLTYQGQEESINNSILAGSPDADVYLVDLAMGVPAALNGYCVDLRSVLPEDTDLFTDQINMSYLQLGDGTACLLHPVAAESTVEATYPLAFNVQILKDAGLEDPRDLYARGEWTWDKFNEYATALAKDTDGDGAIDQYGFAGFGPDVAMLLLMSNGATIASGTTQTMTDAKVAEALQQLSDMYNVYGYCYPATEGDNGDIGRNVYTNGNIGFWPSAAWIAAGNNDYPTDGTVGVSFDTAYVAWPVGPSGNAETNAQKLTSGSYYMIPVGIKDPELVYNVFYDYCNYYNDDVSVRDDRETLWWWYESTASKVELQDANFQVMFDAGMHEAFDLWQNLGIEYDWDSLLFGNVTPAQFQETYKQQIQDGLDSYFK
ncbi:MAG: extracellular solute-binding protein [Lachnospiraceae bacterium]|nr:extracellular solute-binding protein [Lachnospiraceae bacterium]